MNGAAVFKIANQSHGQSLRAAFFLNNGVHIQQRLAGVLAKAVAGVNHRVAGRRCRNLRVARLRATDKITSA